MEIFIPLRFHLVLGLVILPHVDRTEESCGSRPMVLDYGGMRIVGGVDAQPGAWPWLVSIQLPSKKGHKHSCGGSLINEKWILTAAHCVKASSKAYSKWRIVIGVYQLSDLSSDVQLRTIKSYKQHEQYNPRVEANDLAVIELDKPVVFNDFAQPACLPTPSMDIKKFYPCYIGGWGVMSEGTSETADVLQEAKVNQIDVNKCNGSRWYDGSIKSYNLCAGYEEGGMDSCQGDSGGPLMCKNEANSIYYVIGVTSWGRGCAEANQPGVYSSTQYFLDWINTFMPRNKQLLPETKSSARSAAEDAEEDLTTSGNDSIVMPQEQSLDSTKKPEDVKKTYPETSENEKPDVDDEDTDDEDTNPETLSEDTSEEDKYFAEAAEEDIEADELFLELNEGTASTNGASTEPNAAGPRVLRFPVGHGATSHVAA